MPEVAVGNVPFEEAIRFIEQKNDKLLRTKFSIPGEINAKAFHVAGAAKTGLVNDLYTAVLEAKKQGQSIGQFRKQFDQVVQDHGWAYKGKRGWRTRVIYDTNMRTAAMAGKWEQFQRLKSRRPYLIYKTVGDNRVRPEHAAWDGTVLPVDDPWWDTHYPPNDFGCRCTVRSASQRDLDRQGLTPTERPPLNQEPRVNTRTGEDLGSVPKGIGTGWDYNVGKAWLGPDLVFGENAMALPDSLRATVLGDLTLLGQLIQKPYTGWAKDILKSGRQQGQLRTVGYLSNDVIEYAVRKGETPLTATITLSDDRLLRMQRELKRQRGVDLSAASLLSIPTVLARPQAVLWDKARSNLLYIFRDEESTRAGKIAVHINFRRKGDISNNIRSASRIPKINLLDRNQYELIDGEL